jgi:hypothetical protein
MELLERYLQAVQKHLPRERQADIVAELRANMESQLEDKEAGLGRPLTQGEAEDWLRAMGPPVLVASRYRPQQYLIGPSLYPIYLYVLRVALLWAFIIYAIVNTVRVAIFLPKAVNVFNAVLPAPGLLITVAAWVTLLFAALEFVASRYPEKCPSISGLTGPWSPSSLPPLEKTEPADRKSRSYARAVAEVIFGFLFLVWLLLIPGHPFLLMGPGAVVLDFGPFRLAEAWWTFYWWIVVLNALQLAWRTVDLLRGAWQYPWTVQHFVFKIFGLVPIALMLLVHDHVYVLLKNPAVDQAHYGEIVATINKNVLIGLLAIAIIASLQVAWDLGERVLRARNRQATRTH